MVKLCLAKETLRVIDGKVLNLVNAGMLKVDDKENVIFGSYIPSGCFRCPNW